MGNLIYRPPFEADSLLVEATCGCSHNCCSFCTMYKDVPFRVLPESQVEDQLSACRNRHSAELDKKPVRGQEGAILGE